MEVFIKRFLILVFCILVANVYSIDFNTTNNNLSKEDLSIKELIKFNPKNLKEVRTYIREHFKYIDEKEDHWSAPSETIRNGGGDCEDFAIFLMYYADRLGYPVQLVIVELPEGGFHALATINGKLFEPQSVSPRELGNDKVLKYMTLEECLDKCYY